MKKKIGKSISFFSLKGGVGKTILAINMAGIFESLNKKVLIMDLDLSGGGVNMALNKVADKTIFNFVDDYNNNRFKNFKDYVTKYDDFIDILSSPKDPRQGGKIESKYIEIAIEKAELYYDIVLIDTSHEINELNLVILDRVSEILFVVNNDPLCLKNVKSMIAIFKDLNKTNYKILLNSAREPMKKYFTLFDMRNILNSNINYEITKEFYIKNIDDYVMNGEIVTLQKKAPTVFNKDYTNMVKIAMDLAGGNDEK